MIVYHYLTNSCHDHYFCLFVHLINIYKTLVRHLRIKVPTCVEPTFVNALYFWSYYFIIIIAEIPQLENAGVKSIS